MIPEAAVEAAVSAAKASFDGKPPRGMRLAIRLALEAAAPHIKAQALEEAATELDDKRLLSKAFHLFYPEWLRERADKLRPTP